jgi:hypothetical protein
MKGGDSKLIVAVLFKKHVSPIVKRIIGVGEGVGSGFRKGVCTGAVLLHTKGGSKDGEGFGSVVGEGDGIGLGAGVRTDISLLQLTQPLVVVHKALLP